MQNRQHLPGFGAKPVRDALRGLPPLVELAS